MSLIVSFQSYLLILPKSYSKIAEDLQYLRKVIKCPFTLVRGCEDRQNIHIKVEDYMYIINALWLKYTHCLKLMSSVRQW